MFKNRSFLVKVVKDENSDMAIIDNTPPIDYQEVLAGITKCTVIVIFAWIGADTVRRVIVYGISAKF